MKLGVRLLALALPAVVACSSGVEDADSGEAAVSAAGGPKLCVGLRGNGQYIVTHFASLARIVEHYGVADGIAGGSSGSLSTFFYDSAVKNPAEKTCGDAACSDLEYSARVSLTLKSFQGYAQILASSPEGLLLRDTVALGQKLAAEVEQGLSHIDPNNARALAQKLTQILSVPEFRGLVSKEALAMLQDVAHLPFNVSEIKAAIATLGSFSVDDNRLFFRSGVLDWKAGANLFGRIGDFYAGYAPVDAKAYAAWLDGCATAAVGKDWPEASRIPMASGATCGEEFARIVTDYRTKVREANLPSKRIKERIGDPSAVTKMTMTSVLEGDAVRKYDAALAKYVTGEFPSGDVPFSPSFSDVKFGYWGSAATLEKFAAVRDASDDAKTKKMTSLGNATWEEILSVSPAEPGLSRFIKLPDGRISAGGWSDLSPGAALDAIGCERVILVTRTGDESGFTTKIAKRLGMTESEYRDLYDLSNPKSSFNRSLEKSDGVWCTSWDSFGAFDQAGQAADSWNAPLETHLGFAGIATLRPYPNTTQSVNKKGCTPGVSR